MKNLSPKVGLTVTTHRSSRLRPNGVQLLENFFQSFRQSSFSYEYCFYVADNASEIDFDFPQDLNIKVIKIKDQSIKGLTGAWNESLHAGYLDGCDILWNFNDDIELNLTASKFIDGIINHLEQEMVNFWPLSDDGGGYSPNTAIGPGSGYTQLNIRPNSWDNLPNGFSFGFTRSFYEKYRHQENEFFPINHKLNGGDGKWGGQEGYVSTLAERGCKAILINECWLRHIKLKTYAAARDFYKNK